MEPRTENKIILVVRHTRLDELIARFNTLEQAKFYVEHLSGDFSDYQAEDQLYKRAVHHTEEILSRIGRVQLLDRTFLPNFIFGAKDVVVAVGQDGLVANVLKYLNDQPLIGVNPDPQRWEGVLLPFEVKDLSKILPDVFSSNRILKEVTLAEAKLNTGESICAVNDLFVGPRSHTSARYHLQIGDREETHSSSGIIVSTGLGSTGWLRSVMAGATGVAAAASGNRLNFKGLRNPGWDADYLFFSVREPWPSTTSGADITFGKISNDMPLVLQSQMPENGIIFSDGIEADFLQFTSGTTATIALASRKGRLVV